LLRKAIEESPKDASLSTLVAAGELVQSCVSPQQFKKASSLCSFLIENRKTDPRYVGLALHTSLLNLCYILAKKGAGYGLSLNQIRNLTKELEEEVFASQVRPDLKFYSTLLLLKISLCDTSDLRRMVKEAEGTITRMRRDGFFPTTRTFNALIHGYSTTWSKGIPNRDRVTSCLDVYELMGSVDVPPNTSTFTVLFASCLSQQKDRREIDPRVFDIEREMTARGISHTPASLRVFLKVLGAGRRYHDMIKTFRTMEKEIWFDTPLYNAFFHAAKEHPKVAKYALRYFVADQKNQKVIKPNPLTFRWLLQCSVAANHLPFASWLLTEVVPQSPFSVDASMLNSYLFLHTKLDKDEETLDIIRKDFPKHKVYPNQETLLILLSYYCTKKTDSAKALGVLKFLQNEYHLKCDGPCLDLLVRCFLLKGDYPKVQDLLSEPLCEESTLKRAVTFLSETGTQPSLSLAKEAVKLASKRADWVDRNWLQTISQTL